MFIFSNTEQSNGGTWDIGRGKATLYLGDKELFSWDVMSGGDGGNVIWEGDFTAKQKFASVETTRPDVYSNGRPIKGNVPNPLMHDSTGDGWFIPIEPQNMKSVPLGSNGLNRFGMGLHPEGPPVGTGGCIGFSTSGGSSLRPTYNTLKGAIIWNGGELPISIHYLPN